MIATLTMMVLATLTRERCERRSKDDHTSHDDNGDDDDHGDDDGNEHKQETSLRSFYLPIPFIVSSKDFYISKQEIHKGAENTLYSQLV